MRISLRGVRSFAAVLAILAYSLLLPSRIEAGCNKRIAEKDDWIASFVERLRAGGLVIVMRHVEAKTAQEDWATSVPLPPNCNESSGRRVTRIGLDEAVGIRFALASLNVKPDLIMHSEFCRAGQTAHIIFGQERPIPTALLNEGCCEECLHKFLGSNPIGKNIVLVTHSTNLEGLGVGSLKATEDGIAAIFDASLPAKGLADRFLGCVLPKDWKVLADKATAKPAG